MLRFDSCDSLSYWLFSRSISSSNISVKLRAVCDPSPEMAMGAAALAPGCGTVHSMGELLAAGLDGVVIATPSALHAEQAIRALERGVAVFCQKPLGRTAAEVDAVLRDRIRRQIQTTFRR